MGFLTRKKNDSSANLTRLPSGSFTLDREGKLLTSTLPQSFPERHMREISQRILRCFRAAEQAKMPLSEVVIQYAALKVLARELRGGAIIFLMPQAFQTQTKSPQA